jgi:hypothetical protein
MPALQEFPIKGVFTSPIKTLYQYYQQQHTEIANLKAKLAQVNRPQSYGSPQQVQQTTRPIATEKKISLEEYKRIANQSDYVYIKAYSRQDGTSVKAHYRRRPSK